MPVKRIQGTVRTFIPHILRKMPTANKLNKIIKNLHSKGKPFAINVDSSKSNLIYQINISLPLAQWLASQLHELKVNLKIGTNVILLARPIGFGQMDAQKIIQVSHKKIVQSDTIRAAKVQSSSTVASHSSQTKSGMAKSQSAKSNNAASFDKKSNSYVRTKASTQSSQSKEYYRSNNTNRLTRKLDMLTSSNGNNSEKHIAVMYRRLESQPTSVDNISKQLKPIFEQENWNGFMKNINKHAGTDFNHVLQNSNVNNWINYALRSNHIPNNLDKTIKPKTKKKHTINHKDVF